MRYLLVLIPILLAACQSGAPTTNHAEKDIEAQEQKRLEVMAVHDAVMPEMGTINRIARQLKPLLEKEDLPEDEREILLEVLNQLRVADEGMMSWMAAFENNLDNLRDTMNHEAVMVYLRDAEAKIVEVDARMRGSIEEGKKMVEKYQLDK